MNGDSRGVRVAKNRDHDGVTVKEAQCGDEKLTVKAKNGFM